MYCQVTFTTWRSFMQADLSCVLAIRRIFGLSDGPYKYSKYIRRPGGMDAKIGSEENRNQKAVPQVIAIKPSLATSVIPANRTSMNAVTCEADPKSAPTEIQTASVHRPGLSGESPIALSTTAPSNRPCCTECGRAIDTYHNRTVKESEDEVAGCCETFQRGLEL